MPTLYSVVSETGNRNRILEMCEFEFRIWFRLDITSTIFFTDFHKILQAAQECRRIGAYFRHKPEAVC